MELTLNDLKNKLALLDEPTVVELLDLTSQDILDRFEDIIEDRFDFLQSELEIFTEEDEDNE